MNIKYSLLFFVLFTVLISKRSAAQTTNNHYDSLLAKKLNAEELGMKMYVLAILKSGTATGLNKQKRDSIFARHMNNIRKTC